MNFLPTYIPDVIIVIPDIFRDQRGFFLESYQKREFVNEGIPYEFVQDNHSNSVKNTLRGIHYQLTHTQGKLVRVAVGEIFDVAVDLRKNSPFFGQWVGEILSQENKRELWIPPGFGHGFFVLSERADVLYKTTDYYDSSGERCIRWDDPELAIDWPIPDNQSPIVSEKDMAGVFFRDVEVFK
jgi:dTDP-4-dehydrorhamnose 3,5-epimerase